MESGAQPIERVHGGDRHRTAERLGINPGDLLDFSSSINPFGPPEGAMRAIAEAVESKGEICSYPDQWAERFTRSVAEYHSVPPGRVMAANGSIELIHLLAVAFRPKSAALIAPDFCEYEIAFRVKGAEIRFVELGRDERFELDLRDKRLREADIFILSNPNNPTGILYDREDLLKLARDRSRRGGITVVDEAFIDFVPNGSLADRNVPGLVVIRSMTKFYALAGLRLGYLIASEDAVERLKANHWPWSVNALAVAAGTAALKDEGFRKKSLRGIAELKSELFRSLSNIGWLKPCPSAANYLLVEILNGRSSTEIAMALAEKGILVRDCSSFRGLGDRFIRVAVRSADDNARLIDALSALAF